MSIRKQLLERARLLGARQGHKATRLEREAEEKGLESEEVKLEKLSIAKEARAAEERALQFNPRFGREFICSDCAVIRETVSYLIAVEGDDTVDKFRYSTCGAEFAISSWG